MLRVHIYNDSLPWRRPCRSQRAGCRQWLRFRRSRCGDAIGVPPASPRISVRQFSQSNKHVSKFLVEYTQYKPLYMIHLETGLRVRIRSFQKAGSRTVVSSSHPSILGVFMLKLMERYQKPLFSKFPVWSLIRKYFVHISVRYFFHPSPTLQKF